MFHLQGTGKIRNGVELCEGKGKQSIKWALSSQLTGGAVEKNPTARQGDIGVVQTGIKTHNGAPQHP